MRKVELQKKWYHGTSLENWKKIKKEGVLWGKDGVFNRRCTFLAKDLKQLEHWTSLPMFNEWRGFDLILTVKYTPNNIDDDYNPKWWEMIVKKIINLLTKEN